MKALSFIEFWRQKNTSKQNVIFVIRVMNMVLKNAEDPATLFGPNWAQGGMGLGNLLGGLGGLLGGGGNGGQGNSGSSSSNSAPPAASSGKEENNNNTDNDGDNKEEENPNGGEDQQQ